ncbi:MAG: hypothetical protein K5912_03385 [Alphaproteobacteria bacterium]|nr:hypothetical protein [Alphaproteobacteria bacterium]
MKKQQIILTFGLLLLFAGCNNATKTVTRKTVVVEHEKFHDFDDGDPGFGSLFCRDLDDTIVRFIPYDGYSYDYVELGDTLVLKMSKKMFRKEYNRCNTMLPEEMIIDPDSVLYKKNQILKNDSLTNARRAKLRKQLIRNPLQIVASKAERIRR